MAEYSLLESVIFQIYVKHYSFRIIWRPVPQNSILQSLPDLYPILGIIYSAIQVVCDTNTWASFFSF